MSDNGMAAVFAVLAETEPGADAMRSEPEESTVEIGGQTMTQSQFDAARFPLEPGPDAMVSAPSLSPERQKIRGLRDLVVANQALLREVVTALDDLDIVVQTRELDR